MTKTVPRFELLMSDDELLYFHVEVVIWEPNLGSYHFL